MIHNNGADRGLESGLDPEVAEKENDTTQYDYDDVDETDPFLVDQAVNKVVNDVVVSMLDTVCGGKRSGSIGLEPLRRSSSSSIKRNKRKSLRASLVEGEIVSVSAPQELEAAAATFTLSAPSSVASSPSKVSAANGVVKLSPTDRVVDGNHAWYVNGGSIVVIDHSEEVII